jgi:hypothetical protein
VDDASPWERKRVEQVRVLYPGAYEIWRKVGESNSWQVHEEGTTGLAKITLVPVYLNRTGFMQGEPPLEDLADLNLAHWRRSSDLENILHVAGVPILFGVGFSLENGDKLVIGASTMASASDPNAKLSYVEHSGKGIGAMREGLKDLEFQMQVQGLELLIPRPGSETATGRAIDQAAMHAPLAMMAWALKDALEQAFSFLGEYFALGEDAGGSLTVNTDFGVSMRDAADLQTLIAAVNAGHITRGTFLKELKRRGVLSDDIVPEDEVARLEMEAPALTGQPMALLRMDRHSHDHANEEQDQAA